MDGRQKFSMKSIRGGLLVQISLAKLTSEINHHTPRSNYSPGSKKLLGIYLNSDTSVGVCRLVVNRFFNKTVGTNRELWR